MPAPIIPDILGESGEILEVKNRISQVAKVNRPVLILGERGTGKELAAARIHYLSPRWKGPYVTLNCAALSQNLLDSELFGYEAGAFTGAERRRAGRFKAADGGTLFLDEISHLTLEAQAKILRVVEYGSFQLVGSPAEQKVDVRILAATNANLLEKCQAGTFLPDLWDRLSFEIITLPPLRERRGDIVYLAHFFAAKMAQELEKVGHPIFTGNALTILESYDWPGNVRELKNAVERAVYRSEDNTIPAHLITLSLSPQTSINTNKSTQKKFDEHILSFPISLSEPHLPLSPGEFDNIVRQGVLELINYALEKANHNQKKAASLLGMTYHRFRALIRKYKNLT
ncbi:MAG: sigma 54-interacting transcriptional regulator [Deltaproteobacteria bacterium]|jgi:psp operon transcriptional activator|nr:sigma 54-interacting transcriptional regulator [Deltaproteobacteria bacterium]